MIYFVSACYLSIDVTWCSHWGKYSNPTLFLMFAPFYHSNIWHVLYIIFYTFPLSNCIRTHWVTSFCLYLPDVLFFIRISLKASVYVCVYLHSEGQSAAIPVASMEFAAICLRNALLLLPEHQQQDTKTENGSKSFSQSGSTESGSENSDACRSDALTVHLSERKL